MRKLKNSDKKNDAFKLVKSSGNVFQDLGFGKESANLLFRADLMIALVDIFDKKGWSNKEAAKSLNVSMSRISELRHGCIGKFSADLLLKYLAQLGKQVSFVIKENSKAA